MSADRDRNKDKPDKDKKRLARPDYITYGPQGQIEEIFCKLCGAKVAGFLGEGYQRRFTHFPDYIEFKFACSDGSSHVTNLCIKCLGEISDDTEALQLLHDADVEAMAASAFEIAKTAPDMVNNIAKTASNIRKAYGKRRAVKISEVSISRGKRL